MDEEEIQNRLRKAVRDAADQQDLTGDPYRPLGNLLFHLEKQFDMKILEEDESVYDYR